jgi:hypothetical protein
VVSRRWAAVATADHDASVRRGGQTGTAKETGQGEKAALTCSFTASSVVELPGIEPATEIVLTCRNVESDDAKARETTWNDLRIRERC